MTPAEFIALAEKSYNNPQCTSLVEYHEDLARFKYLKRLLRRYAATGDLQIRLILNHLVIIFNVFGMHASVPMVFHRVDKENWPALKTCLVYLNFLQLDALDTIQIDQFVANALRQLN